MRDGDLIHNVRNSICLPGQGRSPILHFLGVSRSGQRYDLAPSVCAYGCRVDLIIRRKILLYVRSVYLGQAVFRFKDVAL